jgi:hypothetical protein
VGGLEGGTRELRSDWDDRVSRTVQCPLCRRVLFYSRDLTRYAASWEEQGDSFSFVLEHEFENQILAALGYSLRWR